ncbi:hydroxymethylbilane synthase [Pedomonas sp. V897]|uniref:hydroxymethylbilane synthase n=1 Tax=Pedomonas sp. V897 TaxID=3446482 RepID=UPI003EE03295
MTPKSKLVIGTRGSPLALAQAHMVQAGVARHLGWPVEAVDVAIFKTSGDRIQDKPLSEFGGKGLFTKELDEALLDGRIDLAVHSMKDVPTRLPEAMVLAGILPREDVRDRLIAPNATGVADLPQGARIGTSSLRRGAQMKLLRPDFQIVPFRGNVQTRLDKLARGEADATLLAAAGLRRLGMDHVGAPIPVEQMLPAPAQAAIGVTVRTDDAFTRAAVGALNHAETALAVAAERAFLARLDGSCRTPIAALATLEADGQVRIRGQILSPDGAHEVAGEVRGAPEEAERLATALAEELIGRGGPAIRALFG